MKPFAENCFKYMSRIELNKLNSLKNLICLSKKKL